MPNCPRCNNFVKEGQKFCTRCGVNLAELLKPKIPPELAASIDIQEKKIAQDPLNPKLYIKLGDIYYDFKFYEEALVQYQKALSIDETNIEAYLKSGDIYYLLKRFDRAKSSYEKALKLQPELLEAKVKLFLVLKELNLISEALELGKEIIKEDPKNLTVHKGLKDIFLQRKMEEEAIEELKTILSFAPWEAEAYKELAQIYEKKKENEKAYENYKKFLELGGKDKDALFFVGYFLSEKGNYEEAIKYFEELLFLEPTNIKAHLFSASTYFKKGDLHKTVMMIDKISPSIWFKLRDDEKDLLSNIFFALGTNFLKNNNLEDAEKYLQFSLNISGRQDTKKELAKVYSKKADVLFAGKQYKKAKEFYEEAWKLDKDNIEYQEKFLRVKKMLASKRKKRIAAILVPLSIIAILIVAFFLWQHFTTGQISIDYSPQEVARIEIDGKEYKEGFLRLKKGEHKILVKGNSGYSDTIIKIKINGGSKEEISISLQYIVNKITGLSAIASSYDKGGPLGGPYPPENAIDGKEFTCWTEASGQPCVGQWIKIYLPNKKSVVKIGILPGYYKYSSKFGDLYWLNNRLRTAELEFSDGRIYELFFEDRKEMKYFDFQPPVSTEWIKLTVKSYYPGSRWDDMCISEIEIWGY